MANMTVDGSGLPQDGSAPPIAPRTVYLVSATLLSLVSLLFPLTKLVGRVSHIHGRSLWRARCV